MKVAVVAAICVERDAISGAAAAQAAIAATLDGVERVDLFATHIDRRLEISGHVVSDPWSLLRHPRFNEADVVIAHWGIHCPLFDAWTVLADAAPQPVIMFHNMTPVELADEHLRAELEMSRAQLAHLATLPVHWWTYSEENRRALRRIGGRGPIRFVPFPISAPRPLAARSQGSGTRLLSIGRLARAKGTDVLIEAAGLLARRGRTFTLELVGNLAYSAPGFAAELERKIGELGLHEVVMISPDVDEEGLWSRLERADVVVCPSRHEGLCVPVIEAYLAGARVVAADGGNLRDIVVSPDPVVPAGDAVALADAMEQTMREVSDGGVVDGGRRAELCRLFTPSVVRQHLAEALRVVVERDRGAPAPWPDAISAAAATSGSR